MLPRYLSKTIIKKKKGLLTIFGILFGLGTFTIFGLTMSVGLIVHHKINAQNSVDIGAIYAAQKQAETLSVLSHLNYQLWQNYKLFSYRYNVLGNVGAYRKGGGTDTAKLDIIEQEYTARKSNPMICPNTGQRCAPNNQPKRCRENTVTNIEFNRLGCPFAFCVWHPYFYIDGREDDTTNPCQDLHEPFALPPVRSGGIGIGYRLAQRKVEQLRDKIAESCKAMGLVNWLVASASYLSFHDEQKKRKEFIEKYFEKIIAAGLDLDGKSIQLGVKNTVEKNLTLPIYRSDKNIYSKRSSDGKGFDSDYFDWVYYPEKNSSPNLYYVQNIISPSGNQTCARDVKSIFDICECRTDPTIDSETCRRIQRYPGVNGTRCDDLQNARDEGQVIGFKIENPNKINFYSQVFMYVNFHGGIFFPFRNPIPMVAQAFSKPFGASFGNPNIKTWESNPPSFPTYPLSTDISNDRYGLLRPDRQIELHRLINDFINPNNSRDFPEPNDVKIAGFSFFNYINLQVLGSAGMVLPWIEDGSTGNYEVASNKILNFPARIMEEIAISPDEYDERNFSILTNYMLSAYIRLKENEKLKNTYIPPDIGHYDEENFLEIVKNPRGNPSQGLTAGSPPKLPFFLNYIERQINWVRKKSLHTIQKLDDIDYTLTSWVPSMKGNLFKGYADFSTPGSRQQQRSILCSNIDPPVQCCFLRITDDFKMAELEVESQGNYNHLYWKKDNEKKHIPHFTHCVSGGRSGFSVEIIHPSVSGVDELLGSEKGRHNF